MARGIEALPLYLKPSEAADYSGLGKTAIYELIHGGRVAYVMVGAHYRVSRLSLDEYLSQVEVAPRLRKAQGRSMRHGA